MRLTLRDGLATLLFAAIVLPYAGYLYWGSVTFLTDASGNTTFGLMDPTGMSAFALVLGVIAAFVGGWIAFGEIGIARYVSGGLGVISLVLGLLALLGENLFVDNGVWETVLGGFIASIVLLWGYAILRHMGVFGEPEIHARPGMTAA